MATGTAFLPATEVLYIPGILVTGRADGMFGRLLFFLSLGRIMKSVGHDML